MLLEPLEQALGRLSQTSEVETMAQVGTQQTEGRVLGGLVEVCAVFVQPEPDHWEQSTGGETIN